MSKLADVLRARSITQAELARRAGVSRPVVVAACQGRSVSVVTWVKLARALGVNLWEISEDAYSQVVGAI